MNILKLKHLIIFEKDGDGDVAIQYDGIINEDDGMSFLSPSDVATLITHLQSQIK
jgi:hypothetical protein